MEVIRIGRIDCKGFDLGGGEGRAVLERCCTLSFSLRIEVRYIGDVQT